MIPSHGITPQLVGFLGFKPVGNQRKINFVAAIIENEKGCLHPQAPMMSKIANWVYRFYGSHA